MEKRTPGTLNTMPQATRLRAISALEKLVMQRQMIISPDMLWNYKRILAKLNEVDREPITAEEQKILDRVTDLYA